MEGSGKCETSRWPQEGTAQSGSVLGRCPFLRLSPALLCPRLKRSQRLRRNKEAHHPNSQHFYRESPQALFPLDILVFSSSKSRAKGEPHLPGMHHSPGFWLSTQPKSDKEIRRKVGNSDAVHWLPLIFVYKHSFFLLCCLLFSGLRNIAPDLIWVSLFKCPNPCKGLVSSCVHFAQY